MRPTILPSTATCSYFRPARFSLPTSSRSIFTRQREAMIQLGRRRSRKFPAQLAQVGRMSFLVISSMGSRKGLPMETMPRPPRIILWCASPTGQTGHVFYSRTHDHSSMAVGFGGLVSTHFDVPANQELGVSDLVVVANGIPSQPVTVIVQ